MPRDKTDADYAEFLDWKVKKLEKELKKKRRHRSRSRRSRGRSRSQRRRRSRSETPRRLRRSHSRDSTAYNEDLSADEFMQEELDLTQTGGAPGPTANEDTEALPSELLEILGTDPTATVEHGAAIRKEIATRLQHIATEGLDKDKRKELNEKYLLPANCLQIGAPTMNPEIKAALTEVVLKRDKGIEARQKQLAAAISGLSRVLSEELMVNKEKSQQLTDICKILCDIQHSESVTRRNFAIFSIKKELKDHLVNTKIDNYLFGENLADTLKAAKAVSKSGLEMKPTAQSEGKPAHQPKGKPLNWKGPTPAARKQQNAARGREAAHQQEPGRLARSSHSAPPGNSSRMYKPAYKKTRRQ